jgi:hypothetical protein
MAAVAAGRQGVFEAGAQRNQVGVGDQDLHRISVAAQGACCRTSSTR